MQGLDRSTKRGFAVGCYIKDAGWGKKGMKKEKMKEGEVRETKKAEEEEKCGEEQTGGEGGGTGRIIPNKGYLIPRRTLSP